MTREIIEGKDAREYAKKIKFSERSKKFDKFILDNIKLKNPKICDLCCGSGDTIELLANKSKEIVGIDASEEMVKICNEQFNKKPNIKIILSSATNIKSKKGYFDYVIITMGLHHIKDKGDVIDETYRILKPEGKLILIDKYYTNKFKYYLTEISKLSFKFDKDLFDHFIISKEANLNLLKNFRILKEEYLPEPQKKTIQTFMFLLEKK